MISKFPRWILFGGGMLAFSAGMVNTIALLGFSHQGATHVTGNVSRFAIALFQGNRPHIYELVFILISFFVGAVLSGLLIRDAHLRLDGSYSWALALESALLFLSAFLFYKGSIAGEYAASMAAGLQNAMASTYSGAILRTTHLTGIVTDLGVLTGHFFQGIKVDPRRVKLFLTLIGGFILGGLTGAFCYSRWTALAMTVPAGIIALLAAGFTLYRQHEAGKHSGRTV